MKISVCIGSSCHLKGSREVVEELQRLIEKNGLEAKIELEGTFCMGNCTNGVSVRIGDSLFSLKPEDTEEFFDCKVLPMLSI